MKKNKYKLEDFFTKTISETSTRMPLLLDGEDTGCHLMVKGIDAKSVQRDRIIAQVGYADLSEFAETIKDKVEREELTRVKKEEIEISLACALVDGWSFGDFSKESFTGLLSENNGLAFAVIAHATTPSNYLAKK